MVIGHGRGPALKTLALGRSARKTAILEGVVFALTEARPSTEAGQRADQVIFLAVQAPAIGEGVEVLIVRLFTGRGLTRIRVEFVRGGGGIEAGAVGVTVEVSHWDLECVGGMENEERGVKLLRAKDGRRWVSEGTAIQLSVA